jgi:lipoprotein-releasing system permease protein
MTKLEWRIAWRYLRSRRGSRLLSLNSLIAVGGVIVSVSALVVIIGVMNGLQNDLRDKILVGSPDIRVLPWGPDMVMTDWRQVMHKVEAVDGVVSVAPFVSTLAMVNTPGRKFKDVAFVVGIPADSGTYPPTSIRSTVVSGAFEFATPDGGYNGAVIGKKLAEKIAVTPGIDSIDLFTIDADRMDPMTGLPTASVRKMLVTGLFDTGMYEYDDKYIFVDIRAAQEFARLGPDVTGLEVRTPTREGAASIAIAIIDTLGVGARTEDWEAQNESLFSALKLEKKGLTFILMLITLVAAFNITGTLTMVVAEKTREIGILRAMGTSARAVRRVFFAQGMAIGVAGTAIGLVIGLAASYAIDRYRLIPLDPSVYFIDHLPVSTQWLDVVMIVLASMAIAAVATLRPAKQAAALYPVDAIRHE